MTQFRRMQAGDARAIADALRVMAKADGEIDPREVKVIERFLRDCAAESGPTPARLPTLAQATEGLTDSFLSACVLLAFADGDFTAEEAVQLRRFAHEVGASEDHLADLVRTVEREQRAVPGPAEMNALNEVLAGWGLTQAPALREKLVRLLARQ